jgi:hypothetical protein
VDSRRDLRLTMNEDYLRSLRMWLNVQSSIPVQRQRVDAARDARVRRPQADCYPSIPAPRSSPDNLEH